jgi:serine/threonine protein kinase
VTKVTATFDGGGFLLKDAASPEVGKRHNAKVANIRINCSQPADPATNRLIMAKHDEATALMQRVIGNVEVSDVACPHTAISADAAVDDESSGKCSCQTGECFAGNLVADAIQWAAGPEQHPQLWNGRRSTQVDFALTNAGPFKLAATLVDGNFTAENAFTLVPDMADVVIMFDVPAKMVWAMLSATVSSFGSSTTDTNVNDLFLQASASLYFEWEILPDEGPKLRMVEVNGIHLEQDGAQNFTIATNLHVANYKYLSEVSEAAAPLAASLSVPIVAVDTGLSEFDALVRFLEARASERTPSYVTHSGMERIVRTRALIIDIGVYCSDADSGLEDCSHMYHMIDTINNKHDGFLDDLLVTRAAHDHNHEDAHAVAKSGHHYVKIVANREHVYIGCSAGKAEAAWNEMHAMVPSPLAVVGIPCSDETGALSIESWRTQKNDSSVVFSQSSTASKIANEIDYPLVVRLSSPESIRSRALQKLCTTFNWHRVALVHDDSLWGVGSVDDFISVASANDPEFEAIRITALNKFNISAVNMKDVLQELVAKQAKIVYLALHPVAQREFFRQIYLNRDDAKLDMYTSLGEKYGNVFISAFFSQTVVTDPITLEIDYEAAMGAKGMMGFIAGSETHTSIFSEFQTHWGKVANKNACSRDGSGNGEGTPLGGPYCDADNLFGTFGGHTLFAADQIIALSMALDVLLRQNPGVVPTPEILYSTLLDEFDEHSSRVGVSGPINLDSSGDRIGILEIQNFQIKAGVSLSGSGAFVKVGLYSVDGLKFFEQVSEEPAAGRWVTRAAGGTSTSDLSGFVAIDDNSRAPSDQYRMLQFPGEINFKEPPADRPLVEEDSDTVQDLSGGAMAAIIVPVVLLVGVLLTFSINCHLQRIAKLRSIDFVSKLKHMQREGDFPGAVAQTDAIPREIKRNAVHRTNRIGTGQFGEVWKGLLDESATSHTDAYMVAIKSTRAAEGEAAEELQREALVMAVVGRHANLVSLIGVVTTGPPLLLVISLCEHGSLYSQLKKRAHNTGVLISLDGAAPKSNIEIAREVATGMAVLASKGFVHRDLAARNVLIDSALVCKVADFGLSRKTHHSRDGVAVYASSRGIFPLRWTPPEAMRNLDFSTATDVWSFGVLMLELYQDGKQPYYGVTNEELMGKLTSGWRAPMPNGCPLKVFESVLLCWDDHPEMRPTFDSLKRFYRRDNHVAQFPTQPQPRSRPRPQLQLPTLGGRVLVTGENTFAGPPRLCSQFEELHQTGVLDSKDSMDEFSEWRQQASPNAHSVTESGDSGIATSSTEASRTFFGEAPLPAYDSLIAGESAGGGGEGGFIHADTFQITKPTYLLRARRSEQPTYVQGGSHAQSPGRAAGSTTAVVQREHTPAHSQNTTVAVAVALPDSMAAETGPELRSAPVLVLAESDLKHEAFL